MFALKEDYDKVHARYEALWNHAVIDRPPVVLTLPVNNPKPVPRRTYATQAERWLDVEFRAEQMDVQLQNTRFLYDALPIVWPNMGPEIFSAWCGCPYLYGETTTWTEPCLENYADMGRHRLDMNHPLFKATERFANALIERGKGRFIVGLTDFHPGGDHLAALRDPQQLCIDMIEYGPQIKEALKLANEDYFQAFNRFYEPIRQAGMPCTSWISLIADGRYYIPSNDFSCMISPAMFEEYFLPGIAEECAFYDRSIYHLDGPGALRHLPALLALKDLDAVQWVPGAGNEGFARWVKVYQQIQAGGKIAHVYLDVSDLPLCFETLRPEGMYFAGISGVRDEETAKTVVERIARWK